MLSCRLFYPEPIGDDARTQTAPCGGTGPNLIRPQTCFSDFRYCSKSVFRNSGRICLSIAREETSLRSSSTTKKTCLLQRSIKWLLGPRLGKTDRCCASSSKGKDRTKDVPATAIVLSTFQKDPLLTKLEYKIRAQNRTYLYVWFWTFLMFFCLAIFFLIFFSSNCFL